MRPTRGPSFAVPALVGAPLLAVVLAGCSTADPLQLPVHTGAATGAVTTPTPSPTSTSTGTGPTTSVPGPTARPVAVTIRRIPLGPGIAATTRPVTEAWFAYWDYVGKAISDPQAAGAAANVGSVATGAAATDAVAQISGLRSKDQHTIGETRIAVTKASLTGAAGSLCSTFDDLSYDVDAKGSPVQAVVPRTFAFSATLKLDGPTWRVQKISRVDSC